MVNAGHDVVVPVGEVITLAHDLELLAVLCGVAVVRHQHGVSGTCIDLRAVPSVESTDVRGLWAAVDGHDQRIALAGFLADRFHENAPNHHPVEALPRDLCLLAESEA